MVLPYSVVKALTVFFVRQVLSVPCFQAPIQDVEPHTADPLGAAERELPDLHPEGVSSTSADQAGEESSQEDPEGRCEL